MGEGIKKYGVKTKRTIRTIGGYKRQRREFFQKPTRADRDIYGDKSLAEIRALQKQERAWTDEKSPIEKARSYDQYGKAVFANDRGTRHSVSIPAYARTGKTTTHIHPYRNDSLAGRIGTTLSAQDVANAAITGERETRAVSSGYTYSMRPQKGKGWGNVSAKAIKTFNTKARRKWQSYYSSWLSQQTRKVTQDLQQGKITREQALKRTNTLEARYNIMVQHKAMQDTAKRYGWIYTRAKTKRK